MYEQGTYHYIQREVPSPEGAVWENVLFENTDQLWRSRSFRAAEKEIARLRGVHGDDARFRVVKREFHERVITPLYFHLDLDVSGTGDWQPVTHGDQGDAWRSRTYWKAFHKAADVIAATSATTVAHVRITRTDDPSFVEVLSLSDFENVATKSADYYADDETDSDYDVDDVDDDDSGTDGDDVDTNKLEH